MIDAALRHCADSKKKGCQCCQI